MEPNIMSLSALSSEAEPFPHAPTSDDAAPLAGPLEVWTAGSSRPNPGIGGHAVILRYPNGAEVLLSSGEAATTNNRAELQAAILAFQEITEPCRVTFYARGEALYMGMSGRADGWRLDGWRNPKGERVKNADLWKALLIVAAPHDVSWRLVTTRYDKKITARLDALTAQGRKRHSFQRTFIDAEGGAV